MDRHVRETEPPDNRPATASDIQSGRRALADGIARQFRISLWTAADRRNRSQDAGPLLVVNPVAI